MPVGQAGGRDSQPIVWVDVGGLAILNRRRVCRPR